MKISRCFVFCILFSSALAACVNEDPAPLFVDTSYQVRCLDCMPASPDDLARNVLALNGEDGFTVECSTQQVGKSRLIVFKTQSTDSKRASNNYGFEIRQANIDAKAPGDSCKIQIKEGANTYAGGCTSGDPTDEKPCHLEIAPKDGIVKGKVLCEKIPNLADATVFRYLLKPNSDNEPASFELHGCPL